MPTRTKTKTKKTDRQQAPRQNTLPEVVAGPKPPELIAFAAGDRVSHPQFGSGTVVGIRGSTLSIAFDKQGTRHIIENYVRRLKT